MLASRLRESPTFRDSEAAARVRVALKLWPLQLKVADGPLTHEVSICSIQPVTGDTASSPR